MNLYTENPDTDKLVSCELLTDIEEKELLKQVKLGNEEAVSKLIQANLRLVLFFVKKIMLTNVDYGNFNKEDLYQQGYIGLYRAIKGFDYTKANKLSTYASILIKQELNDFLSQNVSTFKLSRQMYTLRKVYYAVEKNLKDTLGRNPTKEEIKKASKLTDYQITKILEVPKNAIRLDHVISEENDATLSDFIFDEIDIEKEVEDLSLSIQLKKLIKTVNLDEKELKVITLRYGLIDNTERTLEEVGKIMNLTKERVRQIENMALCKFRRKNETKKYASYMDNPEAALKRIQRVKYLYKEKKNRQKSLDLLLEVAKEKEIELSEKHFNLIANLINSPEFRELKEILTETNALIVALKLKMLNGFSFTTKSIADFFGLSVKEVIEILKDGINILKDNLDSLSLNNNVKKLAINMQI